MRRKLQENSLICSSFEIPVEHEKLQLRRRLLHTVIIATCLKKK
jgi:hypothetical protein